MHVGGGGFVVQRKSHMSTCPPLLSVSPSYAPPTQVWPNKVQHAYPISCFRNFEIPYFRMKMIGVRELNAVMCFCN